MGVTGIIQARSGSTRLPGKVLAPLGNRSLLEFMLHRLRFAPLDDLVVATSDKPADDAVAEAAAKVGVSAIRGPEQDVLTRFGIALDAHPADTVVRMTADCPLLDPAIVGEAVRLHHSSAADYTSNTLIRTFPDGLDVEVIRAKTLRAAIAEAVQPEEREHVTPFVYRRPGRFRLVALRTPDLAGDERWTVDTADDLAFVREVAQSLGDRLDLGWREILHAVGRRSRTAPGRLHLRPAVESDSDFVLALRNDVDAVHFSVSGRPVSPEEHDRWYRARLTDPASRLWISTVEGQSAGQVRVDVTDGIGTVSIALAPMFRGRRLVLPLLRQMQAALLMDLQVMELRATVRCDNVASHRAFHQADFQEVREMGDFTELRWVR